jgi:hypothetical protein
MQREIEGQATFPLHLGSSRQYRETPCLAFLVDNSPDTPREK